MAFLFKSKKQQSTALPATSRPNASSQGHSTGAHSPSVGTVNSRDHFPGQAAGSITGSVRSASDKDAHLRPTVSNSPDGRRSKGSEDRASPRFVPYPPPSDDLYPWSQFKLNFTGGSNPFPRYGAAVNCVASKDGEIYLMGGLINGSTVKGDLWMVEAGNPGLACYPLATRSEGPGPRVGHASLLAGNAFIVFGGDTKLDEGDVLDDTLYLLNTSTKQWSRALSADSKPAGRYGHTLNILGQHIYIFGGQVEGFFFNDLVAFDLNALQTSQNSWEILIRNSSDGGPPEGQSPPARTNHSTVTFEGRLYLFGGTDGVRWFNDVWSYEPRTNSWSVLECIGYIPSPREGHAAAIVGDTMYIFGGRTEDGNDLGDLAAFKISNRRWYTFQNMGHSPSPRSGHSMTAHGKNIIILAGEPSTAPREPSELSLAYVLDTTKIKYPQYDETTTQGQMPRSVMRQPSGPGPGVPHGRFMGPMTNANQDGMRRIGPPPQSAQVPPQVTPGSRGGIESSSPALGPGATSKLPRAQLQPQGPQEPPLQQQAPQPRPTGTHQPPQGGRNMAVVENQRAENARATMYVNEAREDRGTPSPVRQVAHGKDATGNTPLNFDNIRPSPDQGATTKQPGRLLSLAKGSVNGPRSETPLTRKMSASQSPAAQTAVANSATHTPSSSVDTTQVSEGQDSPMQSVKQRERPPDSGIGSSPALSQQNDELIKELEGARNKNVWYASELALARKAGYVPNNPSSPFLDERVADSFADDDRPLIEALLRMRQELANMQSSVHTQTAAAAGKIAELEKQREIAVSEAVYARAKLAAHGVSQTDGTFERGTPETDRDHNMTRRLASSLAAQQQLSGRVDSLMLDIQAERKARQLAEDTADIAQKRVAELDMYKQRSVPEVEELKTALHQAQKIAREDAATSVEAKSQKELLVTERADVESRLHISLGEMKKQTAVVVSLREAVTASMQKAALLERKLEEERDAREKLEQKLIQLRSEHEERTLELEATQRRLRDAEDLAEANAAEAKTHRLAVLAGLDHVREPTGEEHRAVDERIATLQQQIEAANAIARKNQEAADAASDKLRSAEERIAGLEAYQEQASREGLAIRKQLQSSVRESQSLQVERNDLSQQLAAQQLSANALAVQHGALKDLLSDRGITQGSFSSDRRSRGFADSPSSRFSGGGVSELNRMKELETQLEESLKAHEETKAGFEEQWREAKRENEEKLTKLEEDYQSAVKYLRGTERMLSKMKHELQRFKTTNSELEAQLSAARSASEQSQHSSAHAIPENWETEREQLRSEITNMQSQLRSSMAALESQLSSVQQSLQNTTAERDSARQTSSQYRQESRNIAEQLQHLRNENLLLESRAVDAEDRVKDAEQKVQLLLDQVEDRVDSYRRHNQGMPLGMNGHNPPNHSSQHSRGISTGSLGIVTDYRDQLSDAAKHPQTNHSRTLSEISTAESNSNSVYSLSGGPSNDGRNSMALDNLATELDALRNHWEQTKSNRLSGTDEMKTPTEATNATVASPGLGMGEWRKGLRDEDEDDDRDESNERNDRNAGTGFRS